MERPHWNCLTDKAINYMPENICAIRRTALSKKKKKKATDKTVGSHHNLRYRDSASTGGLL